MADVTERAMEQRRREYDTKELIRLILNSPLKGGKKYDVDRDTPLKEFKDLNTDLKTRIFLQIGLEAASGDIKAAEFMMKYGNLEPAKEENVNVYIPRFIEDIPNPFAEEIVEKAVKKVITDPDRGNEDEY